MRTPQSPHQGYGPDRDMVAYWPSSADFAPNSQDLNGGSSASQRKLQNVQTAIPNQASIFNPNHGGYDGSALKPGALSLNNASHYWYAPAADSPGDHVYLTGTRPWTLAFWYDLNSSPATQTLIEYSVRSNITLTAQCSPLVVQFRPSASSGYGNFVMRFDASVGDQNNTLISPEVPARGWLAISRYVSIAEQTKIRWHYNGVFLSEGTDSSVATTTVGSSTSTGWVLGGSRRYGTGGLTNTARFFADGKIEEIALWGKQLDELALQSLYARCLQPWDDSALIASGQHSTRYKVEIEDADGNFVDVSDMNGMDHLVAVTISETVDDPVATASITLRRRLGKHADLSPYNTDLAVSSVIGLRRQIRISRAITPVMWRLQGWEWKVRFEGFIDDYSMSDAEIELSCSDKTAPLNDTFIVEPRSYVFQPTAKPLEEHLQQLIDDYEPALRRRQNGGAPGASVDVVGYRGGKPTVITPGGNSFTPLFLDNEFDLRYNDVSSGTLLGALQTQVDLIGADLRFRYRELDNNYQLTAYTPKRTRQLAVESTSGGSGPVKVVTYEPHGLFIGATVGRSGTASHNFLGTVASVFGPYIFYVGSLSTTPHNSTHPVSVGTVTFTNNIVLQASDILEIDPAQSSVANIRNHAVVRFARAESTFTAFATVYRDSNIVFADFLGGGWLPNIDPDGNGFSFTIEGSGAANVDGTYTGLQSGADRVFSLEDNPSGSGSSATGLFSTNKIVFREVVSTSTPSINEYGLMPVAIYEGSTLAINTQEEAQRLADALIDDLSEPTLDVTIKTRPLPVELHDVMRLPSAAKGQWTDALDSAIVSITEEVSDGIASATYGLRHNKPSRGVHWTRRMRSDPIKPAAPIIGADDIEELSDHIETNGVAGGVVLDFGRQIGGRDFQRTDMTLVWLGNSPDFIPTRSNLVASGRATRHEFSTDGHGGFLSPGTTYYVRYAVQDIFGNQSRISGFNGSGGTVRSVVPRFLNRPDAAMAVIPSTATSWNASPSTFTPLLMTKDDGTDSAAVSFDTFNSYTLASSLFQCRATGTYAVSVRQAWQRTNLKDGEAVVGRIEHLPSSLATPLGVYSLVTFDFNRTPPGTNATLQMCTLSAQVFCHSGDFLRVGWCNFSNACFPINTTTATNNYGFVSFALTAQR